MSPLFWLLRTLGGMVGLGGCPERRPGISGGSRAWEGGRGRGQSQAAPTAPDRTRNSSRTEAGETERERHIQRQRATHSQQGEGGTHTWVWNRPLDQRWAGVRKSSSSSQPSLPLPLFSAPLCLQRPSCSLLTYPFSLQSSRRGCWTDALPQDPILLWWKVEGAA